MQNRFIIPNTGHYAIHRTLISSIPIYKTKEIVNPKYHPLFGFWRPKTIQKMEYEVVEVNTTSHHLNLREGEILSDRLYVTQLGDTK